MKDFKRLLKKVEKPARYLGNEINAIKKDKDKVDVRFAFGFPDIYEVGMSYMGLQILYGLLNSREDTWFERVFAPGVDMEEMMRKEGIELFGLESREPVKNFDFMAFTLQYELSYTNILNMLDLAGIPLYSKERTMDHPIVLFGGPCAYNVEPIADFADIVLMGEGEESLNEVIDLYKEVKKEGKDRAEFLRRAAKEIEGAYVPSLYDVEYNEDNTVKRVFAIEEGIPDSIKKRIMTDMTKSYFNDKPLVPYIEIVHGRVALELFRGCTRGCRFCQAGMIYRPIRERSLDQLKDLADKAIASTGYEEISLASLSTSDYSNLAPLADYLIEKYEDDRVGLSLPSLRLDNFSLELAERVQKVRKSGLTFAPEAGSQRLRDVINKGVTEGDLENALQKAFGAGWNSVKLYFMISLPTENEEDLTGIANLAYKAIDIYRDVHDGKLTKSFKVSVSASTFVPKPFTPFQWEPQDDLETIRDKQHLLKDKMRNRNISYNYHDSKTSWLEAVIARGDRRLSKVIELAFRKGCKYDGWMEHFRFNLWREAFEELGVSMEFYANRRRTYDEILPWDHIDVGVTKEFLIRENEKSKEEKLTVDCRSKCSACGINADLGKGIC